MTSFLIVVAIAILKFGLIYALSYMIMWKWYPEKFKKYKIQVVERQKPQVQFEIKNSAVVLLIQSALYWLMYQGIVYGHFDVFEGFGSRGYLQEVLGLAAYFIFYDAYFYWSHRFLHWGWFYKNVHVTHHKSLNPTPFASYSFHPIEAITTMLYFFPVLYFVPMSTTSFVICLVVTEFGNLSGHLGYEFMPQKLINSPLGAWITTPTHHNMHHQISKANYGLYWNGWDKIFKTQHPKTHDEFMRVTSQG